MIPSGISATPSNLACRFVARPSWGLEGPSKRSWESSCEPFQAYLRGLDQFLARLKAILGIWQATWRAWKRHFRMSLGSSWGVRRGTGQASSLEDARSGESSLTSTRKQVCLSLPGNLGSSESSSNSAKHVAHKLFGRCSEWRILVDVDENDC